MSDDVMQERRVATGLEVRMDDSGQARLVGYAAVFGQLSEDMGNFREIVEPGAFAGTVGGDVRALWNHDSNYVLGRTTSGTLRLVEDEIGLLVEIDPPAATWAQDALVSVRRGDVNQMSFGFIVPKGGDAWGRLADGGALRRLRTVRLLDVSPVAFPSYPQTTVQVRSQAEALTRQEPPAAEAGEAADERGRATLWRQRIIFTELEDTQHEHD